MAITRNDRTATYVNNAKKLFQVVADDGDASTEEKIAFQGTPDSGRTVILHRAGKSQSSASKAATISHDKNNGTFEVDGIGMAATAANDPLVIDIHYKEILNYHGCFTTANRPAGVIGHVIFDADLGVYMRYESGSPDLWVDKGSNYQEPGVVSDVFSSLSIAVSEGSTTSPKAINQANWDATGLGDTNREIYQDGATIDLKQGVDNPAGTGTYFANVVTDAQNTVSDITLSIDQSTGILTINRGVSDGPFKIEWGVN
jgi:hypothetical protein